jgi:hypothetical protein
MKLSVKCALEASRKVEPDEVIAMFTRWIEEARMPGAIDVVDYSHVAFGPGVLLVMDGAEYGLALGERCALTYASRRVDGAALDVELPAAIAALMRGTSLVEAAPELGGALTGNVSRFDVSVLDGRSTEVARTKLEPNRRLLKACFARFFESDVEIVDLALGGAYRAMVRARVGSHPVRQAG